MVDAPDRRGMGLRGGSVRSRSMPTSLTDDISLLLSRELESFERELALFPDDESIWRTSDGVSNSAANLALHVSGNLRHFVGAVMGGTGYVRNRPEEFARRSGTRAEVVAEIADAVRTVRGVLATFTEAQLDVELTPPGVPAPITTRRFLVHLCVHAGFHLGQAGYVRRLTMRDARSTGSVSVARLAGQQPDST
jgi:uncharacterized damage-inducible protein DinB